MTKFSFLMRALCLSIVAIPVLADNDTLTLYGLELGGSKTLQQQLGVGQQSFFLDDGNQISQGKSSGRERAEHQIACKQSSFGIASALSAAYQKLSNEDEYLAGRKEALNRRIKDDLTVTQATLVNSISKKYAQPECHWAFNSAQYADSETPTVVTKFKSKSGIDKLATLTFSVNHQGKLLALKAEQVVERLDAERLDAILAAIAKRYEVSIESVGSYNKNTQKKILEGKQPVNFAINAVQCQIQVKNTYYSSAAAARFFSIDDAHGYVELGCEVPNYSAFDTAELNQYIMLKVQDAVVNLLNKHKAQMKEEGQKEKNSGFVF